MNQFHIEVPVKTTFGGKRDIVTVILNKEDIVSLVETKVKHEYFCDTCAVDEDNIVVKFI